MRVINKIYLRNALDTKRIADFDFKFVCNSNSGYQYLTTHYQLCTNAKDINDFYLNINVNKSDKCVPAPLQVDKWVKSGLETSLSFDVRVYNPDAPHLDKIMLVEYEERFFLAYEETAMENSCIVSEKDGSFVKETRVAFIRRPMPSIVNNTEKTYFFTKLEELLVDNYTEACRLFFERISLIKDAVDEYLQQPINDKMVHDIIRFVKPGVYGKLFIEIDGFDVTITVLAKAKSRNYENGVKVFGENGLKNHIWYEEGPWQDDVKALIDEFKKETENKEKLSAQEINKKKKSILDNYSK